MRWRLTATLSTKLTGRRSVREADRESRRRKLLRMKDVRTLEVPVFPDRGAGPTFPLAYTDSGAKDDEPTLVVIPGANLAMNPATHRGN